MTTVFVLPKVGSGDGDICEECAHIDCADWCLTIGVPCRYCAKPVASGDRVVYTDGGESHVKIAHYVCFLEANE